jgi:cell division protein FtsL
MAPRRVKGGGSGRLRLTMLLIVFLLISGTVILRRSWGNRGARELHDLDSQRAGLVAERLRLEAEIRAATSRARIEPIAVQRLNMHVPADSQVILVPPARLHESQ